jgi:hypothetical protein
MPSKRRPAAEVAAQRASEERENAQRARGEPAPTRTGQIRQPPAPPTGVVRVTLEGERPGPIQSEPIRVPEPADRIELRVVETADAGTVKLQAENGMELATARAVPDGRATYQRPPARQPFKTAPPLRPGGAHRIVPSSDKPAPRYPEAVVLVAYPTPMRKPPSSPWRAVVEVRFIK